MMKIGIIVHSQTGNTLSVAQRIKEEFQAGGHSLFLEQVTAINDGQRGAGNVQLKVIPDISTYDMLIFGAPVQGFSLSPVMTAYLSQAASLQGKKIICFVTEFFPYPWMGGNRAIEQMIKLCESKGSNVLETGIVNWSSKKRPKQIEEIAKKVSSLI